jgi:2-dehydropantoate 2-reductase
MMEAEADSSSTPILIVGTGALATLFACRLAKAGHAVKLLGSWQPGIEALRARGARLVDERGIEQAFGVRVTQDVAECTGTAYAIILVKAWQTSRAAAQLAECLAGDGLALTLQNGLGNYEILARALGSARVALGTTTTAATLLGPGLVKPTGEGTVTIQSHQKLTPLVAALRSASFKVELVNDANSLLWEKLVVNSAINPLTALLRIPNGELLKRPAARALMRILADETSAVAVAENVRLGFADPSALVEGVAQRTAANYSSMLQDIRRGAPTEIEAICGEVVRKGRQDGVATPANDACLRLVTALAQGTENGASLAD